MIRLTCPHCDSKLNAKDELAGQMRRCPKCAQAIRIVADEAAADPNGVSPQQQVRVLQDEGLPVLDLPERLNRENYYLICDRMHLVATWENNGSGWMIKTSGGFASAKRNRDQLPAQGDFKLVELKIGMTPEGRRLTGICSYQLASRWALTALAEGDEPIVRKITGYGSLNIDQKNVVRQALRDQFMREVWGDAAAVLEYLGNTDYHSSGVG